MLFDIWLSGRVKRYHTLPTDAAQNIADHSWGVAFLIAKLHPDPSPYLLTAALYHDLAERMTGDMPSTLKWKAPDVALRLNMIEEEELKRLGCAEPLSEVEKCWLKQADLLELMFYAVHRLKSGDTYYREVWANGYNWFLEHEGDLFPPIRREWRNLQDNVLSQVPA